MLIEGPPGVETQLAKVIANSFDMDFFRIQCYEIITLVSNCCLERMELSKQYFTLKQLKKTSLIMKKKYS